MSYKFKLQNPITPMCLLLVNRVRLPCHVADKRFFCSPALIELATEEDVENVLKQSLVYAGAELELKPK